jgi:type IV pilus assembly protein PilC
MEFIYVAISKTGERQKGLIDANTSQEVVNFLRGKDLTPITIRESRSIQTSIRLLNRVKASDVVLFTRQLSSMILTGLTMLEALNILKKQTTNQSFQVVIDDLIEQISEGSSFSKALQNHPRVFSDVYIALVRAAESGGLLDKVLARLADNMERIQDLKKKVRSALFYPLIIIAGVVGVIIVMNIFVIPQLGKLYESLGLELPLSTQIVLTLSDITTRFFPLVIIAIIGTIFLIKRMSKSENGVKTIDKIKLRIPVFGKIMELSIINEVSYTLSLLITSGTSIIEALNITAQVADNYYFRKAITESSILVEKGIPLSQALDNQDIFEPIVVQMTKVGESTGKLDESFLKLAEYFERDLNLKIRTLTTSLEPLLIVTLGVAVGFLVFSVITPIYSLITQIQ